MSANPCVSVVMNCHNGEKYLREAIDSVYAQTFTDWEIIFWDDGSTDASVAIAKSYDDKLRCFSGKKAISLGEARNFALQQCRGKYIAFLDCDDIWLPEKLAKQVALLEAKPELGMVFSDSYFFNDKGIIKQLYKNYKPPRGQIFKELLTDYFLDIETVIIKRSVLDKLEWFDPRLHVAEEADLFLRIAYYYPVDYVDEPLAKWRVHAESDTFKRHDLFAKENELILAKLLEQLENFSTQYTAEIKIFQKKIAIEKAIIAVKQNKLSEGRRILRPFILQNHKMLALYLLTFLGPNFVNYLISKRVGIAN